MEGSTTLPLARRPRTARSRALAGLAAAGAALLLVACGSNLDPAQVAGTGAAVPGAPVGADAEVPVAAPGEVPGDSSALPGSPGGPGGSDAGGAGAGAAGADGGSGGDGGASGDGGQGTGENAADGGVEAGSCEGFDNDQPGVTEDTITLANASDISGPVPGIFESAQLATRAFVEYYNSTSDLCGHKLAVENLDTRADASADQQAYATACDRAFAAVGSMSAFDSGGAATAQGCGLPDIRSTAVTPERSRCSTCFAAQPVKPDLVPSSVPSFFRKQFPAATSKAAILYINAGAAVPNAAAFNAAFKKAGWTIPYFQGIDVAEFNFAPYVQRMKELGIGLVYYIGPYQNTVKLQQAMAQQAFEPEVFMQDATIQDAGYEEQAGDLAEGSYVFSTTELFDSGNAEMQLYRSWLGQVSPGAQPNFFGLYAWSAARLFVQQATELGGELTRESLIASLRGVKNWTANGLHAPMAVGTSTTANCTKVIRYSGGSWRNVSGNDYTCGPLIQSGTGG